MADYFAAASDLFAGAGSIFSGFAEAGGSNEAAKMYSQAAGFAEEGGKLKDLMLRRQAFQTIGGAQSDVASNGLKLSGSAVDIMRSNAQQAALTKGVTDLNTRISVEGYDAQAASAKAAADAQSGGGLLSGIGSLVGMASAFF